MLGVCALLLLSKTYRTVPSLVRGSASHRAVSASPSAGHALQWQRDAGSISGVSGVGIAEHNGECQMIVDSRGHLVNDVSGPVLPVGIAVSGEVSKGGYVYYTVSWRMKCSHMSDKSPG